MNKPNNAGGANVASRFHGKLTKWNADRGFGFVVADQGGQELFVHVSAFPRDGRPPVIGESLSFELELDQESRKRAVRVRRPGDPQPRASRHPKQGTAEGSRRRSPERAGSRSFGSVLVALFLAVGVGWFGYARFNEGVEAMPPAPQNFMSPAHTAAPEIASPAFQCDGRKLCSQMSSCSEAKQFLANCPGMEMDGDHDGIPCEQQLCSGPLGGG